jgi:hypothetical protein
VCWGGGADTGRGVEGEGGAREAGSDSRQCTEVSCTNRNINSDQCASFLRWCSITRRICRQIFCHSPSSAPCHCHCHCKVQATSQSHQWCVQVCGGALLVLEQLQHDAPNWVRGRGREEGAHTTQQQRHVHRCHSSSQATGCLKGMVCNVFQALQQSAAAAQLTAAACVGTAGKPPQRCWILKPLHCWILVCLGFRVQALTVTGCQNPSAPPPPPGAPSMLTSR